MSADPRVTSAREFLDGARQRKVAELPPALLVRECAELRRALGQVLDVIEHQAPAFTPAAGAPDRRCPVSAPVETERQALELPYVRAAYAAARASSERGALAEGSRQVVGGALAAAGVELGAYDRCIADWLAGWDPQTCAVIAGWVERAHTAGRDGAR